jgi:hypothetical protein
MRWPTATYTTLRDAIASPISTPSLTESIRACCLGGKLSFSLEVKLPTPGAPVDRPAQSGFVARAVSHWYASRPVAQPQLVYVDADRRSYWSDRRATQSICLTRRQCCADPDAIQVFRIAATILRIYG